MTPLGGARALASHPTPRRLCPRGALPGAVILQRSQRHARAVARGARARERWPQERGAAAAIAKEGGKERASEAGPPSPWFPPLPLPLPAPPRPRGRAAARRELQEVEEAEEGVREGGSARPPAAGAAAAAGAASRRGAAEHGAGAAVDTAGIPEAGDALRAPRW